jgi:hypothetical protein
VNTNKQNVEPWKLSTSWGHTKVLFWLPLWYPQTLLLNQHNIVCSKFYKLYKYNINISHNKTTVQLYIEEEQTTQWPKEKVQKDKQRSTSHKYKTKDLVTRTPLKIGGELRCSGQWRQCMCYVIFHQALYIWCFSAKHAVIRKIAKTGCLRIRIMCPSGATCLPADCCELAL